MCSEAEARSIVGQTGAEQLIEIVRGGWDGYVKEGKPRRPVARASVVWDNMMTLAAGTFAARDDVREVVRGQSSVYVMKDRLALQFKMLDRDLKPRNIQTRARAHLSAVGHFDDMPRDLPVVTVGYQLDRSESEIKELLAVRHVANELAWFIDLKELAAGVVAPASPIFDDLVDSDDNVRPLPVVRNPRRKKSDGLQT